MLGVFGKRVTRGSIDTRRLVGFLPEKPVFPGWMAAGRAIEFAGQLADMSGAEARRRRSEVLEQVGLTSMAHRKVAGFSRGMHQRLGLAQAIVIARGVGRGRLAEDRIRRRLRVRYACR
jgi:ABC-2 type transport system ATP-binding protein